LTPSKNHSARATTTNEQKDEEHQKDNMKNEGIHEKKKRM